MARSVSRARVGTARKALAALTATSPPRPVWPRKTPSPPPRATAVTRTTALSFSWFQKSWGMPVGPTQLDSVVNQPKRWARKDTSVHRAPAARPRKDQALYADDEQVGHCGQRNGEDEAHDDRRVVGQAEAVGDLLSQAAESDER